jgi:hypothetical protein
MDRAWPKAVLANSLYWVDCRPSRQAIIGQKLTWARRFFAKAVQSTADVPLMV